MPDSGEAHLWVARDSLTRVIPVPGAYSSLYCTEAADHCLIVTGVGTANAAASVLAVGLSGEVDLTDAYVVVAAVGRAYPEAATIGTGAWVEWVVDVGQANGLDAREIPAREGWLYPFFRLGCAAPWCTDGYTSGTEVHHLNGALADRVQGLTRGVELADNPSLDRFRQNYPGPIARGKPAVSRCDLIASDIFLTGRMLASYSRWWMGQWTNGQGHVCMAANDDIGILTGFERLSEAGKVRFDRVLVLRVASDFVEPYPGQTLLDSIELAGAGGLGQGFSVAYENAYRIGSALQRAILRDWERWQTGPLLMP